MGDVAGHDDLGAETETCEKHLHLLHRRVLCFVEDDERVVEGAAAHVGKGCHLDDARREQLGHRIGFHHVVERVVERAEVGVDLVRQRAGEEAEFLAGLDRGTRQDDAADRLRLQRLDGLGHREVRLSGARWADAEDDGVAVDGVDVALLVERLGAHGLAARADDVLCQHLVRRDIGFFGEVDDAFDGLGVESLSCPKDGNEFGQDVGCLSHVLRRTVERDLVAADVDVGCELVLEHSKIRVVRAEQIDHVD